MKGFEKATLREFKYFSTLLYEIRHIIFLEVAFPRESQRKYYSKHISSLNNLLPRGNWELATLQLLKILGEWKLGPPPHSTQTTELCVPGVSH